tara:strand:+ start:2105 stop:4309 length:2205 start_codon:yes stop_codon:yes gene_type:complete
LSQDLFSVSGDNVLKKNAPLADRLRPRTLDEFVGQNAILAEGRLLRRAIAADRVGNILLYGPPGVGKTTLATIIAENTHSFFSTLNAVLAGIKDVREVVSAARKRLDQHGLRTILFIDEVHRFNAVQQDALLPWVENGTLTLIGATTENPYFEVNKALISRARVFRLLPLQRDDLHQLLQRALTDIDRGYGKQLVKISTDAANHLVDIANGDARSLLNALELAVETTVQDNQGAINIDLLTAEESIQERAVLYDKNGDAHFDTISAFIKSLRGSDPDAALFWLARMVEAGENPKFIFRRMLIAAGEDVGLADPFAFVVVEACASAFERIGLPEGLYPLAHAALYLANTDKSNSAIGIFEAIKSVKKFQRQDVPRHLRDSHRDKSAFGDGSGYKYPHAFADHWVSQQYLPSDLQGEVFWNPGSHGWEGKRRLVMLERRAAQFAAADLSSSDDELFLTNGPPIPSLEGWLHRQITGQSQRLQNLLQKLWFGVDWQRQDRVLVLGSSALLWSITPLQSVPEGGVTILASEKEKLRLMAQLQILDPLFRPDFVSDNPQSFSTFADNKQFEWVGGRLSFLDLKHQEKLRLWEAITSKCSSNAGLRIVFSFPLLGPAASLRKILIDHNHKEIREDLFTKIVSFEKDYLSQKRDDKLLIQKLKNLNWELSEEVWEEETFLKIDNSLEERWFSELSPYSKFLNTNISSKDFNYIRKSLQMLKGKDLPQKIIHKKIIGKLRVS